MIWLTYLTGFIIFAIGAVCKFVVHLAEWQALLPIVFGLGYLTLAEGMRSTKKQSRLFLFLTILWSIVVLIAMIPLAKEGYAVWTNDHARMNRPVMRSELVVEHAGVLAVTACYLILAILIFFKNNAKTTPATPGSSTTPSR
jgi:hypothetical protein